jgi:hypothetical protein
MSGHLMINFVRRTIRSPKLCPQTRSSSGKHDSSLNLPRGCFRFGQPRTLGRRTRGTASELLRSFVRHGEP